MTSRKSGSRRGTYRPSAKLEQDDTRSVSFSLVDGVTLYGGFGGSETALSQRDLSEHETVLSGDIGVVDDFTDNAYTVVYCGEDVAAAVDGVTVTGGAATRDGGGILNEAGILTVTDCTIRDNESGGNGGGIYSTGTLLLQNSTVTANRADSSGGGIGIRLQSSALITGSVISENSASNGGGILCGAHTSLEIVDSTISGNEAFTGAGVLQSGRTDDYGYNSLEKRRDGERRRCLEWDLWHADGQRLGLRGKRGGRSGCRDRQ